ncbi:MAG: hypothetical protein F6K35_48740 [Okeania sp. SIO2H7]|nr:hypothetical protein [Okeania sp. SIO2H7]
MGRGGRNKLPISSFNPTVLLYETSEALIVYNSNNGKLFYNENGSEPGFGDGGEFAVLAGKPVISADDFFVR